MSGGRCLWTKPSGLQSWVWAPGLQRPDKSEGDVRIVEMSGETTVDTCTLQGLSDFSFREQFSSPECKAPSLPHNAIQQRVLQMFS